ncbi:MAG: hypothetical protein K8J31_15820 [Anaerolineae bacterium]|jgi:hypothetical protein|nr:hypothetical protein [Anaerolineae bacterium]
MTQPFQHEKFSMTEPQAIGTRSRYAFWLTASEDRFFDIARSMRCVVFVSEPDNHRSLVEISNEHDPDEAWHWIRTELEEESQDIRLDKIWEDAISWLL